MEGAGREFCSMEVCLGWDWLIGVVGVVSGDSFGFVWGVE